MHSPSSLKKEMPTKAITNVGDSTEARLCVRYAELLQLRQTVLKMELMKSSRNSRIDLKKRTMRSRLSQANRVPTSTNVNLEPPQNTPGIGARLPT